MHMDPTYYRIFSHFLQVQKDKLKMGEHVFWVVFSGHLKILTLEHLLGKEVRRDFPRTVPKLDS